MPILDDERREVFAQLKAQGKKNVEAFLAAGYGSDNQKANEASAARMHAEPEVRARIKELQEEAAEAVGVTIAKVLQGWANIGFADIRDAVSWSANSVGLKDSDQLTVEQAAAIAEISQTDKGALKIKFHDKKGALDSMAKFLGMHKEQLELTGKDGEALKIEVTDRERAKALALLLARATRKDDAGSGQ